MYTILFYAINMLTIELYKELWFIIENIIHPTQYTNK